MGLLFELLDTPNNMYQGSLTTEKRSDRKYDIEFRNVSFKYPGSDTYALKNLNMHFKNRQQACGGGQKRQRQNHIHKAAVPPVRPKVRGRDTA